MLPSLLGTIIAREAEHATAVIVRLAKGRGAKDGCLRNGKAAREFAVSHEQTETNPAQPRERLENPRERHLRRPTDCLGKPLCGGLAIDERRNAHGRKSRRVIRAAPC